MATKQKVLKTNLKWLIAVLVVGLIALLFPVWLTYSESSPKFLDRKIVYSVDNVFAQVPFLPKTSRQVLSRAFYLSRNLDSYKIDAIISLGEDNLKLVDIKVAGTVENPAQEGSVSQTKVQGKILLGKETAFDFETYNLGKELYFKINKGLEATGFDSKNLQGWYQLDLDQMGKDLKVDIKGEDGIAKDIHKQLQSYLDMVEGKETTQIEEISRDGQKYFEIEALLEKDPLSSSLYPATEPTKTKAILLVKKDSFLIDEIKLEQVEGSGFRLVYRISDQNKKPELKKPESAIKINNPVELYLLVNKNPQPSANALLQAVGGEAKELVTTLLTIERLTKVALILPRSF